MMPAVGGDQQQHSMGPRLLGRPKCFSGRKMNDKGKNGKGKGKKLQR